MKLSTVSPLRWETMAPQPALRAISIAAIVSVSVPIWLSLIRTELADLFGDAAGDALDVGDEEVVADELDLRAERRRQELPALPVVLGQAVLDGDDGVLARPSRRTS